MTDWNFPQVNNHKARKPYTCDMCGFTIKPGENYFRYVDVDRGKFVTERYCDYCDIGLFLYLDYFDVREEDDFLPDASELHQFLEDLLSDEDENIDEVRSSAVKCLARLSKKLGWDK